MTMRRNLRFVTFLSFLALALCTAPAVAQTFGLEHYGKLARINDPQIAPNGQAVVVVLGRPNYETNVYDTDLLRVDLKTKQSRSITARKTATHPRWSPSGSQLAFLTQVEGKGQIFVMESDGGEARQVTKTANGVQTFLWKPDGTRFGYLTADDAPKREKFDDAFEVDNNDYLMHASTQPTHLWTVTVGGDDVRRVTSGKFSVGGEPVSYPSGDRVAILTRPSPGTRSFDMSTILAACAIDGKLKNQNELAITPIGSGDWVPAALDRSFQGGVWQNARTLM